MKNMSDLIKTISDMNEGEKKEYGLELVDTMLEMEKLMKNSFDEAQISKVNNDIFTIQSEIWKHANPEFGYEFNNRFAKKDTFRLTLIYFSMLKTDAPVMLKNNDNLLYEVVNSMRCISLSKYKDCMKSLFYPPLADALFEFKAKKGNINLQEIATICNKLTDTIVDNNICFEMKKDFEIFMQSFLEQEVYSRIGVPSNFDNQKREYVELRANKAFNIRNIANAKEVNDEMYNLYKDKIGLLETMDNFTPLEATCYLYFDKYMKAILDNNFELTNYELTLIGIMQYVDITVKNVEELEALTRRMNRFVFTDYAKLLVDNKLSDNPTKLK